MSLFRPFSSAFARTTALMSLVSLVLLASCGGNASRVEAFRPTRFVSFGDEFSLIVDSAGDHNGRKYSINAYSDTTYQTLACAAFPVWSQYVAQAFGFVFSACDPNNTPTTTYAAQIRATYGARVADVANQVAAYQTQVGLDKRTLVTVFAGMWDILDAYNAWKAGTLTDQQAYAQVQAAGAQLGNLVNQITNNGNGGRVLYLPMFDLGLTPFAAAEATTNSGAVAMLSALTCQFNTGNQCGQLNGYTGLRGTVTNNGYWAGLVSGGSSVPYPISTMAIFLTNPNAFGFNDVSHAACLTALPNCTNNGYDTGALIDVVSAASGNYAAIDTAGVVRYLWADSLHFSPTAHSYIGSFAANIALNNPF
jgi:hypothetical protein